MEDDSVPAFARVKQTIRVVAGEAVNVEKRLAYIVDVILGEFGRVRRSDILAVQDYRKRGVFDITFESDGVFKRFLKTLEEKSGDGRLKDFRVFPHFQQDEVMLVVRTYSPFVPLKEIEVVLGKYCKKISFVGKVMNEIGLWTSKYRFKAVLEKGRYPPARFKLGKMNLDCFFNGMPTFCRRCRSYGHSAENCELCQNCGKSGHDFKSCPQEKICNFCFEVGHLYTVCPKRKKEEVPVVALVANEEAEVVFSKNVSQCLSDMEGLLMEVELPRAVEELVEEVWTEEVVPSRFEDAAGDSDEFTVRRKKKKKMEEKEGKKKEEDVRSQSGESEDSEKLKMSGEELFHYWNTKADDDLIKYIRSWPRTKRKELRDYCKFDEIPNEEGRSKIMEFIRKQ